MPCRCVSLFFPSCSLPLKACGPRTPLPLARYGLVLTAREHSCQWHGSPSFNFWLAISFRHWTPRDRPTADYFPRAYPPPRSGPVRGVPEILPNDYEQHFPLPRSPYPSSEDYPKRPIFCFPYPSKIPKTRFKTQRHFRPGFVQVALSELPRRSALQRASNLRPPQEFRSTLRTSKPLSKHS